MHSMPGNGISAHDASGATDNTHSPDSGNLADATLLRRITSPADVKALSPNTLNELCREIRTTLLHYGHIHGGHIGSNLGMVEATVALHRVFDSPHDRIVFDVSHQSYVHKMLTGRAAAYLDTNRFGDVTGFTNPDESDHDQFVLGHTGTSISLACGLAKTRNMEGPDSGIGNVVAVIGDGSLSSGVAFEGLNNAAEQGGNLIIILNDNEMSIAGDFGGMYGTLARLRASGGTAQPNLFNAFGLDYRYVEHGNDVDALVAAFEEVRNIDHPVVVHIHTLKGAGYDGEPTSSATRIHPSSNLSHREPWHSDHCNLSDHDPHEGQCEASHWQNPDSAIGKPDDPRKYYGKMAMAALEPRFASEPGLVVISPATPGSNGITHEFRERAGSHYVDTGITESHAVAFAAGIARAGGTPVVATTASFFQRAYDQFFQEMSLNRSRVTVLDFLGGLSGSDNTHSGAYDVAMFANIPGITMLVPTSADEYLAD
ncbi:1-deoxy-D-xylulose-5-phosphate synthase, partial [Bifidobacterium breve]